LDLDGRNLTAEFNEECNKIARCSVGLFDLTTDPNDAQRGRLTRDFKLSRTDDYWNLPSDFIICGDFYSENVANIALRSLDVRISREKVPPQRISLSKINIIIEKFWSYQMNDGFLIKFNDRITIPIFRQPDLLNKFNISEYIFEGCSNLVSEERWRRIFGVNNGRSILYESLPNNFKQLLRERRVYSLNSIDSIISEINCFEIGPNIREEDEDSENDEQGGIEEQVEQEEQQEEGGGDEEEPEIFEEQGGIEEEDEPENINPRERYLRNLPRE
jgi:hypothetical protein